MLLSRVRCVFVWESTFFSDPPAAESIVRGLATIVFLGAIDADGKITEPVLLSSVCLLSHFSYVHHFVM